jgi:hypothetical protein
MRSRIEAVVLVSTLAFSQGCYHTRVLTDAPPASAVYSKSTVDSLFWGLLQTNVEVTAADCASSAFQEVRVTTNYGYALATVLTLGIWSRVEVEWKCAKEPPPAPPTFRSPRSKAQPPPPETATPPAASTGTGASTESPPQKAPQRTEKE